MDFYIGFGTDDNGENPNYTIFYTFNELVDADIGDFFSTLEDAKMHVAECSKKIDECDKCDECEEAQYLIKVHKEIIEKGYFTVVCNGYEYKYRHHIFNKF